MVQQSEQTAHGESEAVMQRGRPFLPSLIIAILVLWIGVAGAGEWKGLKIRSSTAEDAKRLLGTPSSQYPDHLVFTHVRIKSVLQPDTVVVNFDTRGTIASIFIFPRWGLTDVDIVEAFGEGQQMTYGEFLKQRGVTSFGAGTRAVEKLHYLPLTLPCAAYPDKKLLVVYDDRDVTSGDQLLKLVIFY